MSPTYDALKKLAVGLDISVPQLFTPPVKDQIVWAHGHYKNGQEPRMPRRPMNMNSWLMV